ncbi:MAG TPA: acyltransferase [archaeon]|nr:acyltransferase [archaeon]
MRNLEEVVFVDDSSKRNSANYWKKVYGKNPGTFLIAISRLFLILISKYFPGMRFKLALLRLSGMKIGKNVDIAPSTLDPSFPHLIEIGDGATIGWDVMILCHEFTRDKFRKGKVVIGKNATIGARSLVLAGVTVGNNAVVGACSLVNKNVEPNSIVGGVPIKPLDIKPVNKPKNSAKKNK